MVRPNPSPSFILYLMATVIAVIGVCARARVCVTLLQ